MDEFITNRLVGEDDEAYLDRLQNKELVNLQRQLNATNYKIEKITQIQKNIAEQAKAEHSILPDEWSN